MLDVRARALASEKICRTISLDDAWKSARLVAAFIPLPSEPQIGPLLRRPVICVPRVRGETCELVVPPPSPGVLDWRLAAPEFDALPAVDFSELDLILVPGLAFTRDGRRLGRGKGYYDRLLANCLPRTRRIGVCFETQIVAMLPEEPHDQRVDRVVTELDFA